MNGFGFLEYEDAMDARDVVPGMTVSHSRRYLLANPISQPSVYLPILPYDDICILTTQIDGTEMNGSRLTVQFARGTRSKDNYSGPTDRAAPRPRRTIYRMVIEGLSPETSWQDLKDFARDGASVDVVYSETDRSRDGKGFVEFETKEDLKAAVEKLDGHDFKGAPVVCRQDVRCDHLGKKRRLLNPLIRSKTNAQNSTGATDSVPHHLVEATHLGTATTVLHHAATTAIASVLQAHLVVATTTTLLQETIAAGLHHQEIPMGHHRETPIVTHIVILHHRDHMPQSLTHQTTRVPEAHRVLSTIIVGATVEDILIVVTSDGRLGWQVCAGRQDPGVSDCNFPLTVMYDRKSSMQRTSQELKACIVSIEEALE